MKSGDLIEVELNLISRNDYESILIEDRKPAGFEPVDPVSGYDGGPLGAYVEFRDAGFVLRASSCPGNAYADLSASCRITRHGLCASCNGRRNVCSGTSREFRRVPNHRYRLTPKGTERKVGLGPGILRAYL